MKIHKVVFDIDPVPKPRMVRSDSWRHRSCVDRYWVYKDELVMLARTLDYEPANILNIIFYLPMPQSWSQKKKDKMRGKPHQQKPDTDNLMKAFKDCLMKKDETIYDERSRKFWDDKGRIEVIL